MSLDLVPATDNDGSNMEETFVFYPRPVMAFGYCHCLRLSVCVCPSTFPFRAITHHSFSLEPSNLDRKMQNILVKIPIVLGVD